MVIGYGGQGNYHLLEKISSEDTRIFDSTIYNNWLREISGFENAQLKNQGRILVAEGEGSEEAEESFADIQSTEAVSYTHLDVYKRQVTTLFWINS